MASYDHLSYRLTLHILNTKPIDVLTILLRILTRELSINIHALNAKNKHILSYGQTHQLSHHKQQETASDDHLSYRLSILNYGEVNINSGKTSGCGLLHKRRDKKQANRLSWQTSPSTNDVSHW